jgi:hypothetical protein
VLDTNAHDADQANVPGVYALLAAEAVAAAALIDPRIKPQNDKSGKWDHDYTPKHDEASRRLLDSTSPATKQARRRLKAFDRGEPVRIAVADFPFKAFPAAREIPFMRGQFAMPDTEDERLALAHLVLVYPNDDIEVLQTVEQRHEQDELIARGFTTGEVGEDGYYWPLGVDPTDGQLKRVAPDGKTFMGPCEGAGD